MILDIWEKMYNKAKVEYHIDQVSPYLKFIIRCSIILICNKKTLECGK